MFDVVMNVCLDVRITFANDLELTASTWTSFSTVYSTYPWPSARGSLSITFTWHHGPNTDSMSNWCLSTLAWQSSLSSSLRGYVETLTDPKEYPKFQTYVSQQALKSNKITLYVIIRINLSSQHCSFFCPFFCAVRNL